MFLKKSRRRNKCNFNNILKIKYFQYIFKIKYLKMLSTNKLKYIIVQILVRLQEHKRMTRTSHVVAFIVF